MCTRLQLKTRNPQLETFRALAALLREVFGR
jgi:hypothetical protein